MDHSTESLVSGHGQFGQPEPESGYFGPPKLPTAVQLQKNENETNQHDSTPIGHAAAQSRRRKSRPNAADGVTRLRTSDPHNTDATLTFEPEDIRKLTDQSPAKGWEILCSGQNRASLTDDPATKFCENQTSEIESASRSQTGLPKSHVDFHRAIFFCNLCDLLRRPAPLR